MKYFKVPNHKVNHSKYAKNQKIVVVSDRTADVVDVVYVNMYLDLWGTMGWVEQQGKNSQ
jgi:hypothetical protein